MEPQRPEQADPVTGSTAAGSDPGNTRYRRPQALNIVTGLLLLLCLTLGQPLAVAAEGGGTVAVDPTASAESAEDLVQQVTDLTAQLEQLRQRLDNAIGTVAPPLSQAPNDAASFAGTWFDEMAGFGFAHARVELHQSGEAIHGEVYDLSTSQLVGVVLGVIEGLQVHYRYLALNGSTGWGQGVMRSDGVHIDLLVAADGYEGTTEAHVLHRDHLPR